MSFYLQSQGMGQQYICGKTLGHIQQLTFEPQTCKKSSFCKPVKIQAKKIDIEDFPENEEDFGQPKKMKQISKTSPVRGNRVKTKMFSTTNNKKSCFYKEKQFWRENQPAISWNQFTIQKKNKSFLENYIIRKQINTYEKNVKVCKVILKTGKIQRVAKIYNRQQITQEDERQISSEATIVSNLDHPNILRILQEYIEDGFLILVYQKYEGISLKERLNKSQKIPEREMMKIMVQLIRVIYYLQCQGVSHENICPQNIYVDSKDNFLKLAGFHRVVALDSFQEGSLRLYNNQLHDMWGAGWILFTMMFGPLNFDRKTIAEIIFEIEQIVLSTSRKNKQYSKEAFKFLQRIVKRGLKYSLTPKKALEDPWFSNQYTQKKVDFQKKRQCLKNLRQFKTKNPFQVFIKTYILTQLATNEERMEFLSLFHEINIQQKGVISYEQFKYALTGCRRKTQQEQNISTIFKTLDTNKSNSIEFTEFIVGVTKINEKNVKKYLQIIFTSLDEEQYNQIDFKTIERYLRGDIKAFKQMFTGLAGEMGVFTKDKFFQLFTSI